MTPRFSAMLGAITLAFVFLFGLTSSPAVLIACTTCSFPCGSCCHGTEHEALDGGATAERVVTMGTDQP